MKKISAEEKVYRYLLELLIEHKLQPGSRILEKEIVEKIKVSRTPVRNAIIKLVADGLLEKTLEKGVTIPVPTGEDVKQIFFTREALEGESAFLAAMNVTDEDIAFLKMIHQKEKDAYYSFDKKAYTEANEQFHLNIARISRNKYLERFIKQIYWRTQIFVFYFDSFYNYQPESSEKYFTPYERSSFKDHSEIIDAIINHDAGIARKRMREHISSTYNLLFKPWQKNL
jgi:DNA-binding GntR family transcriptional regulator